MPDVSIQVMTAAFLSEHFLLWRCLHGGPLQKETIDTWDPDSPMPWDALRARNIPLLQILTDRYGACAVIAQDGDQVVGQLRFYPKKVWEMAGGGMLCLQQFPSAGPGEDFCASQFPQKRELEEKTLVVHCMMTGCPSRAENPYQRKGIASQMVRELVQWARQNGWDAVEATAYEDLDFLYQVTGQAGRRFWEALGFRVKETGIEEGFFQVEGFLEAMKFEAVAKGIDFTAITRKYCMRLETNT
jgi:hypothetical protein